MESWNQLLNDIYYRKLDIYEGCWSSHNEDIDLRALRVFACSHGGPIGIYNFPFLL